MQDVNQKCDRILAMLGAAMVNQTDELRVRLELLSLELDRFIKTTDIFLGNTNA